MSEFNRDEFYRDVGRRMRLFRERADLTQEELAERLGVPRSTYANMERGHQRTPADIVWRVSIALGAPVDRLLPKPASKTLVDDAYDIDTSRTSPEKPEIELTSEPADQDTARMIADF